MLKKAWVLLFAFVLVGCEAKEIEQTQGSSVASSPNIEKTPELEQQIQQNQITALSVSCDDAQLSLKCESADPQQANCTKTSLYFKNAEGKEVFVPQPEEMKKDYTAKGAACVRSEAKNMPYFVVEYGQLPTGCNMCEWHYLYDIHGQQLTKNVPIFFKEQDDQTPNNEEFTKLTEQLKLKLVELDYVKCRSIYGDVDSNDDPLCIQEIK
ncbi:hypothetical protein [Neisseria sp. Ec49-e6-T10]|uniref:hypothetical protein n=1 Tax=Neisseria sp. Ec49-e6-T10 TaxID=3140744 RepID=UPI003EB8B737